jgi:hypothetical protein
MSLLTGSIAKATTLPPLGPTETQSSPTPSIGVVTVNKPDDELVLATTERKQMTVKDKTKHSREVFMEIPLSGVLYGVSNGRI